MRRNAWERAFRSGLLAAFATALVTLAASVLYGSAPADAASASKSQAYTVGILTDETGALAPSASGYITGVKAGIALAARLGYHIRYVAVDTGSSISGAQSGAHILVQNDDVLAVIAGSAYEFVASPYFKAEGIPVIGAATTSEWLTDANMFSVYGPLDLSVPATTLGQIFKNAGSTNVAVLSYSIPGAAGGVQADALSLKTAGLKAGLAAANIPLGNVNATTLALQMRDAGVNGMDPLLQNSDNFQLMTAAQQAGIKLKTTLLAQGYGSDILNAGALALKTVQGALFEIDFQPVEMHTTATLLFQRMLKAVGAGPHPNFNEYNGYLSIAMLVQGLKSAGTNPTHASLIKALSGIKKWNAIGLLGANTIDLGSRKGWSVGPNNCTYITKLVGTRFQLVPGEDPICGRPIS